MTDSLNELENLRRRISQLDQQFIELLAERFEISRLIGEFKRSKDADPSDPEREEAILDRWADLASDHQLNPDLARAIIRAIMDQVVREHQEIKSYTS